jgi:NAD(P)-dependent dehydrogenase (short-subunit alcohol dehydrogenase family)
MNEFKNKNIIITGGSSGLGYGFAHELLKLECNIFISGNKNRKKILKLKSKYKKKLNYYFSDLTILQNINIFCSKIKKQYKKIDAIVHCLGGGFGLVNPLINAEDLMKLYKINIGIGAEINRLLVPNLKNNRSNIVHIGSTTSVQSIGSVGYSTMKTALIGYSKTLAINLIKRNILVNTIMPGAFTAPDNHFERMKKNNPKFYKLFTTQKIRIKNISSYKDIFPLLKLIISKDGKMLSGSNILIDACETNSYF